MKVCLNLLAATAGGHLSRARAFLARFGQAAPTSELLVFKERAVLTECVSTDRMTVIDIPIGSGNLKVLRRTWWENTVMQTLMRRHAVDVYLTFSSYFPQMHNPSLPSVVGVATLEPFSEAALVNEPYPRRLRSAILRRTILSSAGRASRVIALSKTGRDLLIEHGIAREKITVSPNGVDQYWGQPSSLGEVLPELGITRPFLLYVSHFYSYKNHARLVEAYARLEVGIRASHQLVLVGRPYNRTYYVDIRKLVNRMSMSNDVVFLLGESGDRLRMLYQRAKLFVYPSLIENCPNIMLEAMMAGAPVLAGNLQPMPETGGGAAEYFDALDAQAISERIAAILENNDQLCNMKERSRAQASRFSWNEFVDNVVEQCHIATGKH